MTYENLEYLYEQDFPPVTYAKASALRKPIRDAVNTARSMKPEKMEELLAILRFTLEHIEGRQDNGPTETPVSVVDADDPLDSLLGPAEALADAS